MCAHILILVEFLDKGCLVKCGTIITWMHKLLRQILTNVRIIVLKIYKR